jgi:hypothetical protein
MEKGRKIYKTMQGKQVDMDLLRQRNELTPAVGNAKVNARGDEIGRGGKIIKKREELVNEYYKSNRPVADEIPTKKQPQSQEKDLVDDWEDPEPTGGWVEDADGNFVKKEDE